MASIATRFQSSFEVISRVMPQLTGTLGMVS